MTSTATPTIWFAPASVVTNSSNAAGEQFLSLFSDPASWQVTASQSAGFVVGYSTILTATDAQLTAIFNYLKANHIQLVLNADMIPIQSDGVGEGVEGFANPGQLAAVLHRISSLGGTVDYISMDTPLNHGHESASGPQLSLTALAQQVAENVALVKAVFPNVQFEDADGGSAATADLGQWAQAFQQATGSPIVQFTDDVNWASPTAISDLEAYAAAVRATGATFGVIGDAGAQTSNVAWALAAESNIAAAEADPLIRPANIVVTSWNAYPTVTAPEGLAGSLAHVAVEASQFAPLYASGYLTGGVGVTVSTSVPTSSYVGSAADAVTGEAVNVPGVQIVAPSAPVGMTFAVVVTDGSGLLGATASGAGQVMGAGTGVLTLTGGLADINAELASLSYTGTAAGTDTIDVTTYDGVGLVDDHLIAVDIAAPITVPLPSGVAMATLYQNIFGQAPSSATLAAAQAALTAGHTLAQVAAPWIAQAQATITALCEQVQGATPTTVALDSLTQALMGGESIAQIRASLAGSAGVQSELATFYQSQYGTAPTGPQLAALTQQLASGTSLAAVEAPLLANSQAEAQITTLYQQVEGQAPDASDLATQARALLTGTSLATIRNELAMSPLVQGNLATFFQHVYDQSPTAAQLASLTTELTGTTTYAQIEAQLTAVAQATVTGLFQSVLNRNPTAQELSQYTQLLTSGNENFLQIQNGLAYSAESAANVTAIYQQVMGQAPTAAMVKELEECLCLGTPNPTTLAQLSADLKTEATLYHQMTGQTITGDALSLLMCNFNNGLNNITVQLGAASTLVLSTSTSFVINGGSGNDVFVATAATLRGGQQITGGSGVNTLQLQGGGLFNLSAPAVLNNIQIVDATEGQSSATPNFILRDGTDLTLNLASSPTNPQSSSAVVRGANNNDVINLGSGSDTVVLGGTGETVHGGSGNDLFDVTGATIGATIKGGSGANTLDVQGGGNAVMGANITGIGNVYLTNAGTSYNFTANATPGMVIHAGADADTITVGSASQTVIGSSGSLRVLATAAQAGVAVESGTGTTTLEITTGGTIALNSADRNVTVQLDAASTLALPASNSIVIDGGAGNDVFTATSGILRAGQQINGGGGVNILMLQGGGTFDLTAPAALNSIQVVDATEGQSAGMPTIDLRNGTALTLNLASNPTNPQTAQAAVHGANNNDVINLGSGNDTVWLGGAGETVHGGSGSELFYVTGATIGATIKGGSGANTLDVQGGGTAVMGAGITGIHNVNLLTAGTSYNFTANTTQGMVIQASSDSDTITVGSASQTVAGSSGNLHVLATAANAGVAIRSGTGSNELEITTGGTVAVNSGLNNITVQLDAAGSLTLNHMQFIHAVGAGGNDTIIAGAAGQVLTGGGANDKLDDAAHYGVTFQDTVAGFAHDTLADFSKTDTIDITGFSSASASATYQGSSTAGVLHVANGSSSVNINLSGALSGGSFHEASDLHGGMFITY
jgi:hypothetical protein